MADPTKTRQKMISLHIQLEERDIAVIDRWLAARWEERREYPKPTRADRIKNAIMSDIESIRRMQNQEDEDSAAKKKYLAAKAADEARRIEDTEAKKAKLVDWNKAEVDAEKAMKSVLKRGHSVYARIGRFLGTIRMNVRAEGLLKGHEVEDIHNAIVALGWKSAGEDHGVSYVEDTIKLTPSPRAKRREPKRRGTVIGGLDAELTKKRAQPKHQR